MHPRKISPASQGLNRKLDPVLHDSRTPTKDKVTCLCVMDLWYYSECAFYFVNNRIYSNSVHRYQAPVKFTTNTL